MPCGSDTNKKIIFIGGLGDQIRVRFELKLELQICNLMFLLIIVYPALSSPEVVQWAVGFGPELNVRMLPIRCWSHWHSWSHSTSFHVRNQHEQQLANMNVDTQLKWELLPLNRNISLSISLSHPITFWFWAPFQVNNYSLGNISDEPDQFWSILYNPLITLRSKPIEKHLGENRQ